MASETYQLAILLTLKDGASRGLDGYIGKLRTAGAEGRRFAQSLDDVRREMNRGFAISGVGVGGLLLLGKGVRAAADFQTSMTDLTTSFAKLGKDGQINMTALGRDMQRAGVIAMRLGNELPGTTEDFVQMMQVLKQNGLDAETIFNGAAVAVGNLAVATHAIPKDVAKDVAQFGQLFKLKPEEYVKAADTFSRLYTSTGIGPAELIEASKYFQGRSGSAIGISGLKDAEETVRLFGLMKKEGMEGSMAGTAADNFIVQYLQEKKAMKKIAKNYGINLELFDEKGAWGGWANAFRQLEPLRKLSEKDRAQALHGIFGQRGTAVASMMVKYGPEGWERHNAEQDETISLMQTNAEVSKNFNNQLEALTGSLKNIVVTGLTPLLDPLSHTAQSLNILAGIAQDFMKSSPGLTTFLAKFAAIGSVSLAVGGAIKVVANAWKLLRFASMWSDQDRMISFMQKLRDTSNGVGVAAAASEKRVAGFVRTGTKVAETEKKVGSSLSRLRGLAANPIVMSLGFIGAGMAIENVIEKLAEAADNANKLAEAAKRLRQEHDDLFRTGDIWRRPGDYKEGGKERIDKVVAGIWDTMKQGNVLEYSLAPERRSTWDWFKGDFWGDYRPYNDNFNASPIPGGWSWELRNPSRPLEGREWKQRPLFDADQAVAFWKKSGITGELHDPNILARLLVAMRKDPEAHLSEENFKLLEQALEKLVGATEMEAAKKLANEELFGKQLESVTTPLFQTFGPLTESFLKLQGQNDKFFEDLARLQDPLYRLKDSAGRVSSSLDNVSFRLANWQPPVPSSSPFGGPFGQPPSRPFGSPPSVFRVPGKAIGGTVSRSGLAIIHADEDIVPAETKRLERRSQGITISYNPTINIHGAGEDAKREFRSMLYSHARDLERIIARQLENGRARS